MAALRVSVLLVIPLLAAAAPSEEARRCSFSEVRSPASEASTHLLVRGTADTVEAGPGDVKPSGDPGHYGYGGTGPIYGQLAVVDSFFGADSTLLAGALGGPTDRRVVVVPWDYDAGCQPTAWTRSARWTSVRQSAVLSAKLRPEQHWVDGTPTLDVFFAARAPYPGSDLPVDQDGTGPLNALEFYTMSRELPRWQQLDTRSSQRWRPRSMSFSVTAALTARSPGKST